MKHKPREIRWSLYCLGILIIMNVASLVILLAQNDTIATGLVEGVRQFVPAISLENASILVDSILLRKNLFHLFVIVCWVLLTVAIYRGKNWGKILLALFIIFSFYGSMYAFSTTDLVSLRVFAVLGWILRLTVLWLLFVPTASRRYFGVPEFHRL
jgi:hypothetical protein